MVNMLNISTFWPFKILQFSFNISKNGKSYIVVIIVPIFKGIELQNKDKELYNPKSRHNWNKIRVDEKNKDKENNHHIKIKIKNK